MKHLLIIIRYIRYFITAKNKHSAHGPFLYEFITKVLNNPSSDTYCERIDQLRAKLYKSHKSINITDFGAGSQINNSKTRKIRDIARNSAKNSKYGELLYRITKFYNVNNVLELGTSLGISTLYLANTKSKVYTLEGCKETANIAKENFEEMERKNINLTLGDFQNTLEDTLKKTDPLDLVFIDGNHQEEATIQYFEKCLKYANNNTIFIFDDIHWSRGMENAWRYIKSNYTTTLTIDLFFIGIVFIKTELSKENYTIRF